MNVLKKITIRDIVLNKKRSIGTIVGIILSTALICSILCMATSFRKSLIQNAINESGYYHMQLYDVDDNIVNKIKLNRDIKEINVLRRIGYADIDKANNDDIVGGCISIEAFEKTDSFSKLAFYLIEGRYPKSEDEIVVNSKFIRNLNYKVGDTITLDVGDLNIDYIEEFDGTEYVSKMVESIYNTSKKTYKIVGVINKNKWYDEQKYSAFSISQIGSVESVYITLNKPNDYKNVKENIKKGFEIEETEIGDVDGHSFTIDSISLNGELLKWETDIFLSSRITIYLAAIVIFVGIVMFTSVFCIRNSFEISITEKMKMYGMLASIGATKKQIKKSVVWEGVILGAIGIPMGTFVGVGAVFVLIKVLNNVMAESFFRYGSKFVADISIVAIIITIILGFITTYFSSSSSARRASKVSPIDNIRSTKDIKINKRCTKVPKFIKKIFKIGGVFAYKNLQRSKKKYKTTVLSLTISIFVFIAMYSVMEFAIRSVESFYKNIDYDICVDFNREDLKESDIESIKKLNGVKEYYLIYGISEDIIVSDDTMINPLAIDTDEFENDNEFFISTYVMDDKSFKDFCKKSNLVDVKDGAILCDMYNFCNRESKTYIVDRIYKYEKGDELVMGDFSVKIAGISNYLPYGREQNIASGGYLVLNEEYYKNCKKISGNLSLCTDNSDLLEEEILKINPELSIKNIAKETYEQKSSSIVISIFLYGFITVITLIGVTNIFNTISSNMDLRQKEFATLKSIGMTKKEFTRMVNLESIFYCSKSLTYGSVLGTIASYALYKSLSEEVDVGYRFPIVPIIISIAFVYVFVYIIMRYSIGKVNKQNVIETIRKENI